MISFMPYLQHQMNQNNMYNTPERGMTQPAWGAGYAAPRVPMNPNYARPVVAPRPAVVAPSTVGNYSASGPSPSPVMPTPRPALNLWGPGSNYGNGMMYPGGPGNFERQFNNPIYSTK